VGVEARLAALGIELPAPMRFAERRFELVRAVGDRITIAGHLPTDAEGNVAGPFGKVGAEVTPEEAYDCARRVALGMMASLKAAGIDLDRVAWRRVFGMVNAAPGFTALPAAINGFSDIVLEVFGDNGVHSRAAVGVAELPAGAPVELEAEVVLLPAAAAAPLAAQPAGSAAPDPGLRARDYAGISPLSIPAEALVRSIDSLSNLFWISIAGTVVTIFLAALAQLGGTASAAVPFGEYHIPVSVLPIAALAFAAFLFWLTASRLKMLERALGDDDLTAGLARDIFRLDPPVLNVFEADNLRPFALLSGASMLLWNWSLFFGSGIGLIFSATVAYGAAASVDELPAFLGYTACALGVMVYGVLQLVPKLRRILRKLHGARFRIGLPRSIVATLVLCVGIIASNPELPGAMLIEPWTTVGPSPANAISGDTLLLDGSLRVTLVGIKAMRPGQTCLDAAGAEYPCGRQATARLQALVQDHEVYCALTYANLGLCGVLEDEAPLPRDLNRQVLERTLSAQMVRDGLALAEGAGHDFLGELQREAQANRAGIWQGAFEPPAEWRGEADGD
jgi:endonuclease YncB( thermonuclease family)/enamine deaminase RidA (YjgF/YER057c/UK114 family)